MLLAWYSSKFSNKTAATSTKQLIILFKKSDPKLGFCCNSEAKEYNIRERVKIEIKKKREGEGVNRVTLKVRE